jgi:hypothetical protein
MAMTMNGIIIIIIIIEDFRRRGKTATKEATSGVNFTIAEVAPTRTEKNYYY